MDNTKVKTVDFLRNRGASGTAVVIEERRPFFGLCRPGSLKVIGNKPAKQRYRRLFRKELQGVVQGTEGSGRSKYVVKLQQRKQGLFRSKLETVSSSREYIPPVQNVSPGCSFRTSLMLFTGLHVDSQNTWVQIHAGNSGSLSHDVLLHIYMNMLIDLQRCKVLASTSLFRHIQWDILLHCSV